MIGRWLIGNRNGERALTFDAAYLASGTCIADNSIDSKNSCVVVPNMYSGMDGLNFIGRASVLWTKPWNERYPFLLRWSKNINLTNFNYLKFAVCKVLNHGSVAICIDGTDPGSNDIGYPFFRKYTDLTGSWEEFSVGIGTLIGIHRLDIIGGYIDNTGNVLSQTQYANIRLVY